MAIVTVKGAQTKEVILDGTYREYGASAVADDELTDVTPALVITGIVNTATAGEYTITYTLPANVSGDEYEVAVETVETRTVTVVAAAGNIDTTFDLGDEVNGESTAGTKYDNIVDSSRVGTIPPETSSAYFSEGALDPYEVKHSRP